MGNSCHREKLGPCTENSTDVFLPALVVLGHGVQQVCERVLRTACVGKYQHLGLKDANGKMDKIKNSRTTEFVSQEGVLMQQALQKKEKYMASKFSYLHWMVTNGWQGLWGVRNRQWQCFSEQKGNNVVFVHRRSERIQVVSLQFKIKTKNKNDQVKNKRLSATKV